MLPIYQQFSGRTDTNIVYIMMYAPGLSTMLYYFSLGSLFR